MSIKNKTVKKHLLTLASTAVLGVTTGAVLAVDVVEGPTVYGRLNVSLAQTDWEGARGSVEDSWDLRSNASRLGIKGAIAIDGFTFKVIYGAEYGIEAADTTNTTFTQRNIFVGLEGDWGRVIAGRHDTPLKQTEGKIDQFNDLDADIDRLFGAHNRDPNIIYYTSPKFANGLLTANIATVLADDADIDGDGEKEDGLFDSISASLVAQKDAWYGALGYHSNASYGNFADAFVNIPAPVNGGIAGGRRADVLRVVGGYTGQVFELGAAIQQASDVANNSDAEDTAYLIGAAYKIDRVKLKAQVGQVKGDVNDEERSLYAVGADYNFNAKTRAYVVYSSLELDKADLSDNTFAIGFDHTF